MEKSVCLIYVAPVVEVIEVEVEKGFAVTGAGTPEGGDPVSGN